MVQSDLVDACGYVRIKNVIYYFFSLTQIKPRVVRKEGAHYKDQENIHEYNLFLYVLESPSCFFVCGVYIYTHHIYIHNTLHISDYMYQKYYIDLQIFEELHHFNFNKSGSRITVCEKKTLAFNI